MKQDTSNAAIRLLEMGSFVTSQVTLDWTSITLGSLSFSLFAEVDERC
jgi:hypothetical protein